MKWGLKGGISIDADSGPPRYVLWCCGVICHELLTFFQIGCGHTVLEDAPFLLFLLSSKSKETKIFWQKFDHTKEHIPSQ